LKLKNSSTEIDGARDVTREATREDGEEEEAEEAEEGEDGEAATSSWKPFWKDQIASSSGATNLRMSLSSLDEMLMLLGPDGEMKRL